MADPTLFNVCDYWFNKDQNRLRDIRPDALGQILNVGNIRPGGRYLAVDDASGIVIAGILDRLGGGYCCDSDMARTQPSLHTGNGRLISVCDVDSPPAYPVTVHMNFKKEVTQVLSSLNWATVEEDYISGWFRGDIDEGIVRSYRECSHATSRSYFGEYQVRRTKGKAQ